MPRPLKLDRPTKLEVSIPESLRVKLDLELWSELEGRVPVGRYSELISRLVLDWLVSKKLHEISSWRVYPIEAFSSKLWVAANSLTGESKVFLKAHEAEEFCNGK